MSKMGELMMERRDDIEACQVAEEEQAFHNAVQEVAGFIASGAVTMEQVEAILRREKYDS